MRGAAMNDALRTHALREGARFNGLEAMGAAIELAPEGGVRMRAERLLLRDVHLHADLGEIVVARLTLRRAHLMLTSPLSTGSLQVQGLQADEVDLEGVEITPGGAPAASLPATDGWRLDALGTLHGLLEVYIRDAAWVVDAHIRLPVAHGRVDFNRVVVEHVGPNSSMGLGRHGIYMEAPSRSRTDLFVFDAPQVPGASYEQRGGLGARVTDRGRLDLPVFLEGLLSAPVPQPMGRPAGPEVARMLDRTKLTGELRLGDGPLGSASHHLLLAGHAQGKNCMALTAAVLGQRLVVRVPELSAAGAVFACLGQPGRTGPVSARIEAHITAPAHSRGAAPGWTLAVHHMKMHQVRLGAVA
jgi:hypothetical protein